MPTIDPGCFMGLVGPRVMRTRMRSTEGLVTTPCAACGAEVWGHPAVIATYPDARTVCVECAGVDDHHARADRE